MLDNAEDVPSVRAHTSETEPLFRHCDASPETIRVMSESHVFWYGDNLDVMRDYVADRTVDLIYLDPPFNSQRTYNRFFNEADATPSDAQRRAFKDYWTWGKESDRAYDEIVLPKKRHIVPATLSTTMEMLRRIHQINNMMAYHAMMAVRLV